MSTLEQLDWDLILQPLAGALPCGVDLQYDAAYSQLRLERQAGPQALPAGVWERQAKKIDWDQIGSQCFILLNTRSKDLQVAAWMVEAFVHAAQLPGAARSLTLLVDLTLQFWPGLYPLMAADDMALRVRPVVWLLRESMKWLSTGILATPQAERSQWLIVQSQFLRLDAWLSEQIPEHAPSFHAIHAALEVQCRASLANDASASSASSASLVPVSERAAPSSRDAAYDQLREIAVFLGRIEPHSPVPLVLAGLVEWRNASFDVLLERLPQNGPSVYELIKLFKAVQAQ